MNRLARAPVVFVFLSALPALAHAADSAPVGSAVSVVNLLQVILALAVVLAAIALFAWLLRRWMPGQSSAGGVLRVVGGVMVGPKERLVLVEMGEIWILVGVSGGSVNLVHTLPKPAGAETAAVAPAGFARLLKQAVAVRKEP